MLLAEGSAAGERGFVNLTTNPSPPGRILKLWMAMGSLPPKRTLTSPLVKHEMYRRRSGPKLIASGP